MSEIVLRHGVRIFPQPILQAIKIVVLSVIFWVFSWLIDGSAQAQFITVVTDNSALTRLMANGLVEGTGVELASALLKRAGLPFTVLSYPLKRAAYMMQTQPNMLSVVKHRTAQTESLYKWVGKAREQEFHLYALKSRHLVVTKLDDVKELQIAVIDNDDGHRFFLENGFSPKNLQVATTNSENVQKLLARHIDVLFRSKSGFELYCKLHLLDCKDIELVYAIDRMKSFGYVALSKQTDDAIVEKVRKAYSEMQKDGTFEKIMSKP